ncbi:MAG: ankyrin repeat domain-containing protein [Armatimonadetes bacterium]|nr:ankyrin repeat domain-containing protein [Armatimonadota bacterium]
MAEQQLLAIHRAFQDDDAASVKSILAGEPDLRARINERSGPFGSPAITNVRSVAMLDVLLEAGADIDLKSDWWAGGFGILHVAEPPIAQAAIERGASIDVHAAARLGMTAHLRDLLDKDPSLVHARGGDGQYPLHFAANVEIAALLLDRGADINARDLDHESTAAQWMVAERQEVARYLVERGCDTDILMTAALGDTELARRIVHDAPEAVRVRVSNEYFPMIGGRSGGTIYQWTLGWYVSAAQVAKRFGHQDIFDLLVEASPADERLINACWLGDSKEVSRLVAENPGLAASATPDGTSQIAHAARNNDLAAVELFLAAGFPVNARSQHGATCLHWSGFHGNADMTRALLAHGPDLADHANDFDGTPVEWACYGSVHGWEAGRGRYAETVDELMNAGSGLPKSSTGSQEVLDVLTKHGADSSR